MYISITVLILYTGVEKDGTVCAVVHNPAVTQSTLRFILAMKQNGLNTSEIVKILRKNTVPEGYTPFPWRKGTHSTMLHLQCT